MYIYVTVINIRKRYYFTIHFSQPNRISNSVFIPERIKCTKLHPSCTHFVIGFIKEATNVSSDHR